VMLGRCKARQGCGLVLVLVRLRLNVWVRSVLVWKAVREVSLFLRLYCTLIIGVCKVFRMYAGDMIIA
jgi:hypothetical protein